MILRLIIAHRISLRRVASSRLTVAGLKSLVDSVCDVSFDERIVDRVKRSSRKRSVFEEAIELRQIEADRLRLLCVAQLDVLPEVRSKLRESRQGSRLLCVRRLISFRIRKLRRFESCFAKCELGALRCFDLERSFLVACLCRLANALAVEPEFEPVDFSTFE